MKPLQVFG